MPKKDFLQSTMQRIDEVQPVSKTSVLLRNVTFGILIVVLSFVVSWLLSSYLYDIFYTVYIDTTGFMSAAQLSDTLLELLFIAILAIIVVILIYRRTDWPLVRNQVILLVLLLFVVGSGGGLLVTFASVEFLESPTEVVEKLPYREMRRQRILENLEERNIISGKVASINPRTQTIEIHSDKGIKEYKYTSENRNIKEIEEGDRVLIKIGPREEGVVWILKIPPKDEVPLRGRRIFRERRLLR
jgi:uncharacterized membrane protein YhdT